ncbi:MAG: molybdopterin-dependent oxidoreductase, partial [Actinomycetota bacterium]|nr:molybdopterin-dependent oxidoreductase [Actinomycetota bacterium]
MTTPSEDRYRQRFSWKRVAWGTHCANCLSSCTYRVFAGDSSVRWEEQSGTYPATEPGVPDRNPMGCQKGAAWSRQLTGDDRLLHPMRRVGERGSGQWERITWDDALTEIADAVLDAIEESGPDAVVIDESAEGGMLSIAGHMGLASALGAVSLDSISTVNDVPLGHYLTFGHIAGGSSSDDTFHAELVLVWHCNPAYSRIPYFHYLTEARYHGAEVALIAPDYSPSAPHCDTFVPVVPGTDAALALAMCRVIVDEGLVDEAFVSTQTDLSLLVRTDTRRLLRQSDLVEGGSEYGFFHWNPASGAVEASQDTLQLAFEPALRGRFALPLADGTRVGVVPAFQLLVERLAGYDPEAASAICGVHPDTIRALA